MAVQVIFQWKVVVLGNYIENIHTFSFIIGTKLQTSHSMRTLFLNKKRISSSDFFFQEEKKLYLKPCCLRCNEWKRALPTNCPLEGTLGVFVLNINSKFQKRKGHNSQGTNVSSSDFSVKSSGAGKLYREHSYIFTYYRYEVANFAQHRNYRSMN